MDSQKINFIAGSMLAAMLSIVGSGQLVDMLYPSAGEPEAVTETAEAGAGGATAPAGDAPAEVPVATLLASADVAAGEKAAKKCASCHSFEAGGENKIGPALHDVVGRGIGKHPGFNFSAALANHGGDWSYELLDSYLLDPKNSIPGNKMAFAGIKRSEERAQVIAYLRSITTSPPPLPETTPAATTPPGATTAPAAPTQDAKPAPGAAAPSAPAAPATPSPAESSPAAATNTVAPKAPSADPAAPPQSGAQPASVDQAADPAGVPTQR